MPTQFVSKATTTYDFHNAGYTTYNVPLRPQVKPIQRQVNVKVASGIRANLPGASGF